MNKTFVFRCDCCGLIVDPQVTEDCPRCKYPVKADKEERFLQSSIHDLQRVSAYGGGNLKVDELIRRYQSRLICCTSITQHSSRLPFLQLPLGASSCCASCCYTFFTKSS